MTEPSPAGGAPAEEPPVEKSNDLAYLWALCVDHGRMVLLVTSLFAAAGAAYTALVTPVYQAEALLQIERADGGAFGGELFSMFQEDYQPATQQEILQSRMVLVRAAMQAGIGHAAVPAGWPVLGRALRRWGVERPGFLEGSPAVWAGEGVAVEAMGTARALEDVPLVLTVERGGGYSLGVKGGRGAERLGRALGLPPDGGGFLGRGREGEPLTLEEPFLNLLVTEIDAPPGARFELVRRSEGGIAEDLLRRFVVRERGLRTGVLELRLSGPDPEEIVRTLDTITEVFLRQNISRRTAEASSRLEFLESYIPDVRRALADAEEALSRYQTSEESVNISQETLAILQNMVAIESQLNELAMEEDELAGRYTRNHPGYRVLLEQRDQLDSEKRRLERRAGALPDTQREVLRLNREVEVSQAIYTQMRNAMQELQIAQAGTIGNVRILDNALAERSPVFPNAGVVVGLSVVAGLAASVIALLLIQVLRRGIDNIDQIRAAGLEVVSTIPLSAAQGALDRLRGDGEGRPRALLRRLGALLPRRRGWADGGAPGAEGSVLALATSDEPAVEAIRSLRTSVYFIMKKAGNNVLMITGPTRGVGKSFVSSNLAAVYALTEKRVLLIDADLRKGRIHRTFRLGERDGLSDALAGRIPAAEAVKRSGRDNLDVMPRGRHLGRPSEMLMSEAFSEILRDAGSDYDLVLVDTPPVTAVTDAVIVGRHAGASLLVTRYRVNTVKEIAHAHRILRNEGIGIDGVVFNGVAKSAKDYYYYGYGYGYGHGGYDEARGRGHG